MAYWTCERCGTIAYWSFKEPPPDLTQEMRDANPNLCAQCIVGHMPNPINPDFEVHLLNDAGVAKAKQIAQAFSDLVAALDLPTGREASIVRTHLQDAGMWAKRAIAMRPEYLKT